MSTFEKHRAEPLTPPGRGPPAQSATADPRRPAAVGRRAVLSWLAHPAQRALGPLSSARRRQLAIRLGNVRRLSPDARADSQLRPLARDERAGHYPVAWSDPQRRPHGSPGPLPACPRARKRVQRHLSHHPRLDRRACRAAGAGHPELGGDRPIVGGRPQLGLPGHAPLPGHRHATSSSRASAGSSCWARRTWPPKWPKCWATAAGLAWSWARPPRSCARSSRWPIGWPLRPAQFGIIAGGRGGPRGYNPLLAGDNDFLVDVASTRLPGAADFVVLPVSHAFMMVHPLVQQYTLRFLETGHFISPERAQPIPHTS